MMMYDKLAVVLLMEMASARQDSINCQIASYVLAHMNDLSGIGIVELAKRCHTGTSSISRFCKEIGLQDFAELKELLAGNSLRFQRTDHYGDHVIESIKQAADSVSLQAVRSFCHDLDRFTKVAIFGILKGAGIAFNLKTDLLMLSKPVFTTMSFHEQLEYLHKADKDTLILLFSHTGSYFEYVEARALSKNKPKIYMVAPAGTVPDPAVDMYIYFESVRDQISHPYQMQYIAGLIAQEYAAMHPSVSRIWK